MEKAIGMVEFTSIARGIYVADQMVKISEVEIVTSVSLPSKMWTTRLACLAISLSCVMSTMVFPCSWSC